MALGNEGRKGGCPAPRANLRKILFGDEELPTDERFADYAQSNRIRFLGGKSGRFDFDTELYRDGYGKRLLKAAASHISEHRRELPGKIVALTHPWYYFSRTGDFAGDVETIDSLTYLLRLKGLLNAMNGSASSAAVLFETADEYASFSHALLERGMVKDVILTQRNTGYPFSEADTAKLNGKKLFVGGGYYGRRSEGRELCFDTSLHYMFNHVDEPEANIRVVPELVMKEPDGDGPLLMGDREFYSRWFVKQPTVSLRRLYRELGLNGTS
jgi:hypothetical protein